MSAELLTILPNLSIGVVAVLAFAWISLKNSEVQEKNQERFIKALDERARAHEASMTERENALRTVEREIRTELSKVLSEATRVMENVVDHIKHH